MEHTNKYEDSGRTYDAINRWSVKAVQDGNNYVIVLAIVSDLPNLETLESSFTEWNFDSLHFLPEIEPSL